MNKMQQLAIKYEACRIGVEEEALAAFVEVESGGKGFINGKLVIQFEPHIFKRREPNAPKSKWYYNKIEGQTKEWIAFNDAFAISPNSAMESTSIGLGQVMGFHYKRLGYDSVGDMWDDAKRGEDKQIHHMAEFIKTDRRLIKALKSKNWHLVATYYNGGGYRELAKKWGRTPYDISMKQAYDRYKRKGL